MAPHPYTGDLTVRSRRLAALANSEEEEGEQVEDVREHRVHAIRRVIRWVVVPQFVQLLH